METPIPITSLRRVSQIASGCELTLQLLVRCSDAVFQDDYYPPRASLPLWVGRSGLPGCELFNHACLYDFPLFGSLLALFFEKQVLNEWLHELIMKEELNIN